MPQSYSAIYVHIVFATKGRQPFLQDRSFRSEMHAYLGGTIRHLGSAALSVGGPSDHVHILANLSRDTCPSDLVRELKKSSTSWAKERPGSKGFRWQTGFGAFSIGHLDIPGVVTYISGQEEHRRKVDLHEEFKRFLDDHGMVLSEKFSWD